jgi:hypothetical protein
MLFLEELVNTMAPERAEVEALAATENVCVLLAVAFEVVSATQEGIEVTEYVRFVVTVTLRVLPSLPTDDSVGETVKTSVSVGTGAMSFLQDWNDKKEATNNRMGVERCFFIKISISSLIDYCLPECETLNE